MKVYRNINTIPHFNHAVVTIGTFDGVHVGHQLIIQNLIAETEASGGESLLITFHPHPRKVVYPDRNLMQLNTLEEKIGLLKKYGIHNLVVAPFTKAFSELTAMQYIEEFLVGKFNPAVIIIGYDHKFGNQREGDFKLLEAHAQRFGYRVKEMDEKLVNNAIVSSTRIRNALSSGDVDTANRELGYSYFFTGMVVDGNKFGRTMGFPTANLEINDADKLIPGNGVYAVTARLEGEEKIYKGMMNIGIRPTVDGTRKITEVHLFDFDRDIYGRHLTVWLQAYIRNEIKFSGTEALKAQLATDKQSAIQCLNHL
ncbi:MAG: bifunctional riboflavin kinase/FAD synthetase [Bacteroidetes bacterium]|nr:bifunctional riboflavin kinase/FAD synthetase [Bacteroidota bacterium]